MENQWIFVFLLGVKGQAVFKSGEMLAIELKSVKRVAKFNNNLSVIENATHFVPKNGVALSIFQTQFYYLKGGIETNIFFRLLVASFTTIAVRLKTQNKLGWRSSATTATSSPALTAPPLTMRASWPQRP